MSTSSSVEDNTNISNKGERVMEKHDKWLSGEHEYLLQLIKEYPESRNQFYADKLTEKFGFLFTDTAVRFYIARKIKQTMQSLAPTIPSYGEKHEINKDGSQSSDKLIAMTENDTKSVDFLLQAHGFDLNEWELVSARNNIWNTNDKDNGIQTLYSSKITVKPKLTGMDWDRLLSVVENAPSVFVKPKYIPGNEHYLNIPLFDMHFGISDYNHYKPTQAKVLNLLKKSYKETLFIIGSDLFHHNDHRNRTASGREIEHADMSVAWEEAVKFYEPILHEALKCSEKVTGIFIKGNHSESLEWAFTKYLSARFPQITFDTDFKERKVHMLGNVMVAATHGDKARKRLNEVFPAEFPLEWSRAKTRELFIGHLHTEEVIDKGGMVQRALSTRNKTDSWHENMGYTTSHKRFQVFEYSRDEIENIHFV
ncbi:hypothetical protein MKY29_12045 [Psychrobacillus sp. FSL K6-2365]|uniref:hypothetical protein n=1 Tax=Psychrobacillus sp. FSL K6-2365 TaxID=2921546 RepID=UPI0030F58A68